MEFPPTLVINLDHRTDKWKDIQHEFKDWYAPVERVSAVKYDPGWKGCYMSQLQCVKIAKERNYPWVLYIEDDCMLTPGAKERFIELLPFLWDNRQHWDMFMGGICCLSDIYLISHMNKIFGAQGFGAHFSLVHRDTYDRILSLMDKPIEDITEPCDVYFRKYMRVWTTTPFLALQRAGHSDISDCHKDSYDLYGEAEKLLLYLL